MTYPFVLSWTCSHTKIKFERWVEDEPQADELFAWLFRTWGEDIKYSID
jgi:hypothetical protein